MANSSSQLMISMLKTKTELTKVREHHGRRRVSVARMDVLGTEAADHEFRMTRLRAHDVVTGLRVMNTALGAGLADIDVVVRASPPLGSVADPIAIANALPLSETHDATSAVNTPVEILGTGTTPGTTVVNMGADAGKELWEMIGAAEPEQGTVWEIVALAISDPAAAGTLVLEVEYIAGD